ncbi:hypothetical protein H0A36_17350 [Endozoicomonas sp. SM1973]|uniref:DUF4351 domain-containing protein n=1 Tax=Spartinivicinus marinus TaxID=2994442 RepID=A0A853I7U9_9GAMM|nr:hypothetical protein [Spartinivicinus marinus]MCX4030139.1 hypothetical protein [Spartinivicinus marinus]NYZ67782.1 hypothetical protein [Spartinivicinus marinus]
MKNLVAALFRLENIDTIEHLAQVIGTLVKWLEKPEQSSLRQAFVAWLKQGPLQQLSHESEPKVEALQDLHEVQQMLSKRVGQWVEQWKSEGEKTGIDKGIEIGEKKGIDKGRVEGQVNSIRFILQHRFGPLPTWVDEKLLQADSATLNRWLLNAYQVEQLENLFK